jgi:ketosteroid isomerase-like protein
MLSLALAPAVASAQIEEPRIPLQTKMSELNRFRVEYAEAYNKKDAAAVSAMYSADAIIVDAEGSVHKGGEAIKQWLTGGASSFPHMVIESDSMSIYGNTAVDVGMVKMHPAAGGEMQAHYMVVLRRSMNGWKLVRGALTPAKAGS